MLFSRLSLLLLSLLSCLISPALSRADTCSNATTIAAGYGHTVGLREDGTVVAAGDNRYGQLNVSSWTDIKAVAAGYYHTVGLKEDGTVMAAGQNYWGDPLNVSSWTDIKAVAAGAFHTVGLKSDGTVIAVGNNYWGQLDVSSWTNIKAIAAGDAHTVGLKEDGTVVAVGGDSVGLPYNDILYGQLDVSSWTEIKAVAAGGYHTVGLKEDGTVVAVGANWWGQLDVSSWANIKAIAAGDAHTVGLKEDGTAVAVGYNYYEGCFDARYGQLNVTSWTNLTAIAAGTWHTVGLKQDGTVVAVGGVYWYGQLNVSSWTDIRQPACGNTDTAPPVTSAVISGTLGNNGWYVSDVAVSLTAVDADSGVKEVHYSVNGGAEVVIVGSSASVNFISDGTFTVSYYAVDNAGNTETPPYSVSVSIDKTPPTANISVTPELLWPSNHKMVDVLVNDGSADATSGVASVVFTVADEYGTVQPAVSGFNTIIPLEAWRGGMDMDGRHYKITAVVTDKAGNQTTASTEAVCPHDMRDKK